MFRKFSTLVGVILVISLILVLGLVTISSAASLQVDGSAGCDNSGTPYYCDIQAAIDDATAGDTINVAAGTYAEQINVTTQVTIEGANAAIPAGANSGVRVAETIIDGGFIVSAGGTKIDGVTIQNGRTSGSVKVGVAVAASNVTIEDSIIENVSAPAQSDGISTQPGNNNLTLTNSTVQNNWRGIYLNPGDGHTLTGNLIDANNGVGVGIGSDGQSNLTLTGNTISNHTVEGWGASAVGANVVASGNTFTGNGVSVAHYGGSEIDASDNWWGTDPPSGSAVSGDVAYVPWCTDSTCATSFGPVHNVTQDTYFIAIQPAITAAAPGDTIEVAAGTYTENVIINKALTLNGAQAGVDARGRVIGVPNPAVESVVTSPSGIIMELKNGSASMVIDGFALVGGGHGIRSNGGPLNDLIVRNNHVEGTTSSAVFLNDSGADITFHQNVFDGSSSSSGGLVHLDTDAFHGFWFTSNWVRNGVTGFFVDGNRNVGTSTSRSSLIQGNTFLDNVTGANFGKRALDSATVSGNTFEGNDYDGMQGGPKNTLITGNQFLNNGRSGLALTSFGDADPAKGAQNCTISGNSFSGNVSEDVIFASNQAVGTISTNVLVNNSLLSAVGARYGGAETIVAVDNWWGDATGPDTTASTNAVKNPHDPSAGGSAVIGDIDAVPWYATDTTTPSTENVTTTHNPVIAVSDTIQGAVDAALPGDTVSAADGNYEEQVVIDKDLTLVGQSTSTVIQAPTTVPTCAVSSYNWHAVVCVVNDADVTIDTFTVDGLGRGNAGSNNRFMGIAFRNAGGVVQNSDIVGIQDTPFSGVQHGVALNVYNDDAASRTLDVLNNNISTFQKNAMAIATGGSSSLVVDIDGNDVQGAGATAVTAQNGIQVYEAGGSLTGTITNNTVDGIAYDNTASTTKWVATSILNFYADVDITDNTVTGAQVGVYFIDASGDILDNDITVEPVGNGGVWGIIATDPPTAVPSPYDVEEAQNAALSAQSVAATLTVDVSGNTVIFSGGDNTSAFGIEADAGYGADDIAANIDNNTVTGFEAGIDIWMCQSGCNAGVFTEVSANNNCLGGNDYGLRSNASYITVDGEENHWGDATGPTNPVKNPGGTGSMVSDYVDFEPWINTTCGDSSTTGNWQNTTTLAYDDLQGSLDAAMPGETIVPVGDEPLGGGGTITQPGVTINLNGKTVGPGSPFLTVAAADVTLLGPGTLDGGGSGDPAILVQSGGDNFIMEDAEIKGWADGVEIAASVDSFKLANNWIHDNTDAGLQIDSGVTLGGIVTIEGNLFKVNGGNGVQNDSGVDVDVTYNSWGDNGGPTVGNGDGVSADVTFTPWTFSEVYLDMNPDNEVVTYNVNEDDSFDVALKVDAVNLSGVSFRFIYDTTLLTLNTTTFNPPWVGNCLDNGSGLGVVAYVCNFPSAFEWTDANGRVATLNFTADLSGVGPAAPGPWSALFDISALEADTSSGAIGGVKVFVNNAGYGASSNDPARDITDSNDGQINITGTPEYTGYIDLQGRTNDSGATLSVYGVSSTAVLTVLSDGDSASSGKYATQYLSTPLALTLPYWFQVDAPLYLPTTVKNPLATDWADSKVLSTRPLTTLGNVILLGGDASNDDVIDLSDATCIGGAYGLAPTVCGAGGSSDVNGDGAVSILDLVLMGGNYYKTSSPWTP